MPDLTDKLPDKPQSHDRSMTERDKDGLALDINDLCQAHRQSKHRDDAALENNFFGNDSRPLPCNAHRYDWDLDQAVSAIPLMLDQTDHW